MKSHQTSVIVTCRHGNCSLYDFVEAQVYVVTNYCFMQDLLAMNTIYIFYSNLQKVWVQNIAQVWLI